MKFRLLIIIVFVLAFGFIASPAVAKRIPPKPVSPVIKDGIEYSAPLDSNRIGYVIATWQKTKRVIWSKQIYVIKYEFKSGLEQDVQWVFVTKLRLADTKLIITNELGYEYELDLDSLNVRILKGHGVIDNADRQATPKDTGSREIIAPIKDSKSHSLDLKIGPYLASLFGGIGGAIVTLLVLRRQRHREYQSLILSFSAELVTAFERCVMYYTQAQTGQVSYSHYSALRMPEL